MSDYFLGPEVYFCRFSKEFVFLDLRRDDYTLVNGKQAQALLALFSSEAIETCTSQCADALEELLQSGLLTKNPDVGRALAPTIAEAATEPLVDCEDLSGVRARPMHIANFFAACTSAATKLHLRPLVTIVRAVQRRKLRYANDFDIEKARLLTEIFLNLRSLFPRNYLCLYDSLALLDFLARYGVYPSWVFGVMLEPWAAHCWVQEKHFMLNEDIEEAAAYTPVMVI